ncbi:YdbL family protein [Thauera sp. JM12B12]|uniref:YdbL family protein n=1 Tax=Thauera sp. JM12B12 TaxID=3142262 RepID=UPI0031F42687
MNRFYLFLRRVGALVVGFALAVSVHAQGNLEIDTPAISALKQSMQKRHGQLAPLYAAGAVGLASDGSVALRDAGSVPLAQRAQVNSMIAAENADRAALYREIARANDHPEWEADVRRTFAQRWIDRAQPGWWVQRGGNWVRK